MSWNTAIYPAGGGGGGGGNPAVQAKNVAWVSPTYGNDGTGLVDNRNFPFATVAAAQAAVAAVIGAGEGWVWLTSDTYTDNIVMQDRVNYWADPGAILAAPAGTAISDGGVASIDVKFLGSLEIIISTPAFGRAVHITGGGGTLILEFLSITETGTAIGAGFWFAPATAGGRYTTICDNITTESYCYTIRGAVSVITVRGNGAYTSTAANAFNCQAGAGGITVVDGVLQLASTSTLVFTETVILNDVANTYTFTISQCNINRTAAAGSATTHAVSVFNGSFIAEENMIINSNFTRAVHMADVGFTAGGNVQLRGVEVRGFGTQQAINNSSALMFFEMRNGTITGGGSNTGAAVTVSGVETSFMNCIFDSLHATGYNVDKSGAAANILSLANCVMQTIAQVKSIGAAAATEIRAMNVYADAPSDATITYLVDTGITVDSNVKMVF